MFDTIIIGGGPAGVAAAVYAARKQMKTLVVAESFGGQSIVSAEIENWIGSPKISGVELAQNLESHLRAQRGIDIHSPEKVEKIAKTGDGFTVITDKSEYLSKTVILAHGARRRKLGVPGEKEFDGKGVVYCSTCDAPLFRNKKVAVVGGGNAGLEAVEDLLPYAAEVYLLNRDERIKGDAVTFENIKKSDKLKQLINNAEVKEIRGNNFVSGLVYVDNQKSEEVELEVSGVFIEIGSMPNAEIVEKLVNINQFGEITIDHRTGATSMPGIFAAGDITDSKFKQNNISAGDGVKAALSAYEYLKK